MNIKDLALGVSVALLVGAVVRSSLKGIVENSRFEAHAEGNESTRSEPDTLISQVTQAPEPTLVEMELKPLSLPSYYTCWYPGAWKPEENPCPLCLRSRYDESNARVQETYFGPG